MLQQFVDRRRRCRPLLVIWFFQSMHKQRESNELEFRQNGVANINLLIQLLQLGPAVMSISLAVVNDNLTYRLFCYGTRINLILHGTHCQKSINVGLFRLAHAVRPENGLLWKIKQATNQFKIS